MTWKKCPSSDKVQQQSTGKPGPPDAGTPCCCNQIPEAGCYDVLTFSFALQPQFGCTACGPPGGAQRGFTVSVPGDINVLAPYSGYFTGTTFCSYEWVFPLTLREIPVFTIVYEDPGIQVWAAIAKSPLPCGGTPGCNGFFVNSALDSLPFDFPEPASPGRIAPGCPSFHHVPR